MPSSGPASLSLALALSLSLSALAQGTVPVGTAGALDRSNSSKTAVSDGHTLNVVYIDGGVVKVTRSVGGGAWEPPVTVSGTKIKPSRPVIVAGSDGTVAVAFISDGLYLYYTYRPRGGQWSAPVEPLGAGKVFTNVAMVAQGTQVHMALAGAFDLIYALLPIQEPAKVTDEFVALGTLCCKNIEVASVSIALAGAAGKEVPYFAYAFSEDGTTNTNPCCTFHQFQVGVRVAARTGSASDPWNMHNGLIALSVFEDVRVEPAVRPKNLVSLSMAAAASGDVFLGYADALCTSSTDCTSPVGSEPPFRTKLAHYDAAAGKWSSSLVASESQMLHLASRNSPGVNVRLARRGAAGCLFEELDWHGSQRLTIASNPVSSCTSDPQSLFFQHACGASCDLRAVYVQTPPLAIATYPACAPTPLPDLVVGNITAPAGGLYANGTFPFKFTVTNNGTAPATENTRVRITLTSGGKRVAAAEQTVTAPVAPGGSVQLTANFSTSGGFASSTWSVTAVADVRTRICEGNEQNNERTITGAVVSPPVCTFTGCSIVLAIQSLQPPFPVRFTVHPGARGCLAPAGTTYQWYQRFGSGPWSPIPGATSSSVVLPDGDYEVRADVTSGAATCSPTFANTGPLSVSGVPLDGWALVLLAAVLAAAGAILLGRSLG
jgi:CARDB